VFVPFSFHCLVVFCANIANTQAHTGQASRAQVCEEIAAEAIAQDVNPVLAVAVAWRESAFTRSAVSSAGAVGPLQVMPRFWCKSKPCDYIEAGIRALKHYTEKHGLNDGLCAYASGRRCRLAGKQSRRYLRDVRRLFDKFSSFYLEACDGC
jgi:hypothetical protein